MTKKFKFPETIYVSRQNPDTEDECLAVEDDLENIDMQDGSAAVGIYKLSVAGSLVRNVSLEED